MKTIHFIALLFACLLSASNLGATGNAVANFSWDPNTPEIGESVSFTDESVPNAFCTISSWTWDFGADASPATSTMQNPTGVTYSTPGDKTVTLALGGCASTPISQTVTIVAAPIPTMSQWALFILALLLTSLSVVSIRRRKPAKA